MRVRQEHRLEGGKVKAALTGADESAAPDVEQEARLPIEPDDVARRGAARREERAATAEYSKAEPAARSLDWSIIACIHRHSRSRPRRSSAVQLMSGG